MTGALFYWAPWALLLGSLPLHGAEARCAADRIDEQVAVKHVHDGDTIVLTDGRKIRLIGVNTPELARDDHPAEPLANQAREALRQHLGEGRRIGLRYGSEKNDTYGRHLAHLFLDNGQNINEWLLQQGLAMQIAVPPNLWQTDCYRQAEQQARQQQKGLWSRQYLRILQADTLPDATRGFQVIRGRVERIGRSRNTTWINLGKKFALRITDEDLAYFKGVNFQKLIGKPLEVRGWVQYHNRQLRMRIRHPASMQVLAD